jgi:enoyl-[acyl-carrier-protein] reductase (NADH)
MAELLPRSSRSLPLIVATAIPLVGGCSGFLLSDETSFITGGYHLIDGGYTAV